MLGRGQGDPFKNLLELRLKILTRILSEVIRKACALC
jgi:hypothetical protein